MLYGEIRVLPGRNGDDKGVTAYDIPGGTVRISKSVISDFADIAPGVSILSSNIGAAAVIAENATIEGSRIEAQVYVGSRCQITGAVLESGASCGPNCIIQKGARLRMQCWLESNNVVEADGVVGIRTRLMRRAIIRTGSPSWDDFTLYQDEELTKNGQVLVMERS